MAATFTVKVDTGNAAFEPDPAPELVRILRRIADELESGLACDQFQTIFDANGNDVGRFALKPEWYR